MKRILVICDYYLPSVNSGGGMWTVVNFIDRFSDRYEFFVLTRNYDSPGDTTPYTSVKMNDWNNMGKTRVFYASNERLTAESVAAIVNEVGPDCIFLNSVFGTPVVKFLTARRKKAVGNIPVVISPTGNLAKGVLVQKRLKKKLFLAIAKILGLYNGLIWKPSSELESAEIRSVFGSGNTMMIAPDLTPRSILLEYSFDQKLPKQSGSVRFIFLSRIVKKKNLGFLLDCLKEITEGNVTVDIVGPQEDTDYWNECLGKIAALPHNIVVNIVGSVTYLVGLDLLLEDHFFVLPTRNENFGYVFIESLAAGTPIIISDQTIWGSVENETAGWVIPLDDKPRWVETLRRCVMMDNPEYAGMAASARRYAEAWLADATLENATARVFDYALEHKPD